MKDLKCALRNCKHNRAYSCCADQIKVDRHANCTTYEDRPAETGKLFEMGADMSARDYSVDTGVGCDAPCLFNKCNKCAAIGITVLAENADAECVTYTPS
ncbi:MAG: DUF1540 domain-containing protein [Firmicutes bacterium]|nr:DUF1540 domain-containing protein [Bacillota bacterium]